VTVNAEGRVIRLDLSGGACGGNVEYNKVAGSLPATLGELGAVEELNLSWSQLTGESPDEVTVIVSPQKCCILTGNA
ncbi:unnamed protein product, partial [Sphacelaria rigidula]